MLVPSQTIAEAFSLKALEEMRADIFNHGIVAQFDATLQLLEVLGIKLDRFSMDRALKEIDRCLQVKRDGLLVKRKGLSINMQVMYQGRVGTIVGFTDQNYVKVRASDDKCPKIMVATPCLVDPVQLSLLDENSADA